VEWGIVLLLGDRKALHALFISLLLEALQGDPRAAKELLDRGYGKIFG